MIDPKMYDDPEFYSLDAETKFLWVYLLTGPEATHGCPGLLQATVSSVAGALRVASTTVDAALRRLALLGWVEEDRSRRIIRVPKAPLYRRSVTSGVVWAWYRYWERLPDCELKYKHVAAIRDVVGSKGLLDTAAWKRSFGAIDFASELARIKPSDSLPFSKQQSFQVAIPLAVENSQISVDPEVDLANERLSLSLSPSSCPEEGPVVEASEAPAPVYEGRAARLWDRLNLRRGELGLPPIPADPGKLGTVQGLLQPAGELDEATVAHVIDAAAHAARKDESREWLLNGIDLWKPNCIERQKFARTGPRSSAAPSARLPLLEERLAKEEERQRSEGATFTPDLEVGPMPWELPPVQQPADDTPDEIRAGQVPDYLPGDDDLN